VTCPFHYSSGTFSLISRALSGFGEDIYMNAESNVERPCTISESIDQSCKEVLLMQEGLAPKRGWKELKHELESDTAADE
jgi:hypothetical protein